MRLGHEAADRRGGARLLGVLASDLHDLARELGDPERVDVHLGGNADEEVELHPLPALRVRALDRGVQVVVGDELVDHLADPPRAAFGREGEPGAADLLDLAGDADGERVDPQRRQREADVAAPLLLVHQPGDEAVDPREVGGRQRRERDLVVAGATQAVAHHRAHLVGGTLAHGPGDHPGLAEAAAPRAAAEDLDVEAVVHHLDERHELVLGVGPVAEVGDGALVDALGHVGEARPHLGDERAVVVDLVHRRARRRPGMVASSRSTPSRRACARERFHAADHLGDLAHRLLAVADHERVDEVGHGLGVERAVPADDHERVLGPAVLGPHGHAGEVEALEHVGVHELGGEAEGDHVEVAGRVVGVDREQRHAARPASPAFMSSQGA